MAAPSASAGLSAGVGAADGALDFLPGAVFDFMILSPDFSDLL
jgi:hypothetical protein